MPPTTKIKSSSSIESVGIGRTPFKADLDVVRLRPEDGIPEHIKIYDCIAYLMICFQHNKIAVNNIENGKVIWLPFVSMQQEGITWQQAAREGVVKLIGKRDAELEAKLAKIPKFEANPLHFMRIEMPENKFYIRYSFFVNIEKSNERPCCEDNELINWIAFSEIPQLDNIWGPELKEFAKMLFHAEFKIQELNLEDQIRILSDKTWGAFLVAQKISQTKLIALYEEFIEHCYPSIYMCQESLKSFLIHFGYSKLDNRYPAIFNSFDFKRRGFIDFNEFVLGLVCMEPTIDNDHPFRIQMLFRFYNTDNTGELSFKDLQSLIRDLNLNEIDPKRISVLADEIWKKIRDKDRLSLEAFEKAIQKRIIKGTEKLLISSKPILQLVMEKNKIKHHHQDRSSKSIRKPKSKLSPTAREKGVCNSCRPQNYQICLHCVCFDSDGRCVKPLRLFDVQLDETITPYRYSVENVFGMNTISRNFLDLVRNAYQKGEALLTGTEEQTQALVSIRMLCEIVIAILRCEEKCLRIQAPVLIIGNLNGQIDNLMSMEKSLWKSAPILTNSLVFLGNYSGSSESKEVGKQSNSVEVIFYLFALKISSPNMVFLMRGFNETLDTSEELCDECVRKYGEQNGKIIWNELNTVFARLPLAVIIDESIICLHSGIPRTTFTLNSFNNVPESMTKVMKDSPFAFEILSSLPNDTEKSYSEKDIGGGTKGGGSSGFGVRKAAVYDYNQFVSFMRSNGLQFLIRGHDTITDGYQLYFNARCLTISSASAKHSIVALIDGINEEIRILKVLNVDQAIKVKQEFL